MRAPFAPTGLVDPSGRSISKFEVARVRANASVDSALGGSAYEGAGSNGTFLSGWPASLQSADRDWLPVRNSASARVGDTIRNNVLGQSAVTRKKNAVVGRGWRIKFRPNWRALGITKEAARELGAVMSNEFQLYGYGHAFMSDAERRMTFGQQLRLAVAHICGKDGEAVGLAEWAHEEDTRYKTRLKIVDPDRLSNQAGKMNGSPSPFGGELRGGIETNARDVPMRYWFRQRHQADFGFKNSFTWLPFDRWTEWGRPQVFHCFEVERAGQSRGISKFVAALRSFRALDRFTNATLEAATINALIVGYMKSNSGPQAAGENFEVNDIKGFEQWRQDHYEEKPVKLAGGAVMPVIPYGDEIKLETAARDVGSFDAFVRSIVRLIAAALGVTYEELSMDYSQTNYSSARAAMLHAWADTQAIMGMVEDQLVRPFVVAWLEEAFDRGYVVAPDGAPDFYEAIDAYAVIHCIGPGRGFIDPTKEIDAAAARVALGISTLQSEAEDLLGEDLEDIQEQRKLENDDADALDLPRPHGGPTIGPNGRPVLTEDEAGRQRDERPAALARVAAIARSPEHNAALDQRGG
jgi:lambda family phage portal protein